MVMVQHWIHSSCWFTEGHKEYTSRIPVNWENILLSEEVKTPQSKRVLWYSISYKFVLRHLKTLGNQKLGASFTITTTGSYTITYQQHKLDSFHFGPCHITMPYHLYLGLKNNQFNNHFLNWKFFLGCKSYMMHYTTMPVAKWSIHMANIRNILKARELWPTPQRSLLQSGIFKLHSNQGCTVAQNTANTDTEVKIRYKNVSWVMQQVYHMLLRSKEEGVYGSHVRKYSK
jgi:hypothetical protein